MRPLRFVALFVLALTPAVTAPHAQALGAKDAGTTGAQFLRIGISPRLAAMAEAYGALGDDAGAIYSNPAGLSAAQRKEVEFVHAQLVADLMLNSIYYVHPMRQPLGTLAFNYTYLDYGDITRTILNAPGAANPFTISGKFNAYDQSLAIAYSDHFLWRTHRFRWGITAKLIQQTIDAENATGLAYDMGMIYSPETRPWRLGLAVQNLGFLSKFRDEADPLPINFKISGGLRLHRDRLRLGLDLNLPVDNTPNVAMGVEYLPIPQIALRGGYRFDNSSSDYLGPTVGVGLNLAGISLDYAYVPFEDLGNNHRFSLAYAFGPEMRPSDAPKYEPAPPVTRRPPPRRETPTPAPVPTPVYTPAPTPAYVPEPEYVATGPGCMALPFTYLEGPADDEWLGGGTTEVLHHEWKLRGMFNDQGPFLVQGEVQTTGGVFRITARLSLGGQLLGTFTSEGPVDDPFDAWTRLIVPINGRLKSLGVAAR